MAAIIGRKLGMTQVFAEDGTAVAVTVIEAGPCMVTAVRRSDRDGYEAVQLAFGEVPERKLTRAELGHLKKAGAAPLRTVVEFRDELSAGEEERKVGSSSRDSASRSRASRWERAFREPCAGTASRAGR
jgi:ribosomal protein L3